MKLQRFAAIDIGSNAVRILFSNIIDEGNEVSAHKAHIVRCPVRLGSDVFTKGFIGDSLKEDLMDAFIAFKHLIKVYKVTQYKAYATSALRNASNREQIVRDIYNASGILIELIDGNQEAEIIYSSQLSQWVDKKNNYLYMDVGGGSTELSLFEKGKCIASKSFKLGTIRLLNNTNIDDEILSLKNWISELNIPSYNVSLIGSGGNINRVFKISQRKKKEALELDFLKDLYKDLSALSIEERMLAYDFNPDRADVIVHALSLFTTVMKECKSDKIFVPKIGLADGIINEMLLTYKQSKI